MPTWNQQNTLRQAIDSVLSQTCQDFELIIVDDHSGQETRDILASYLDPRIRKFRFTENTGTTVATNHGLAQAKGEWAVYFCSDDLLLPSHLETMLSLAHSHEASCVLCAFDGVDMEGKRTKVQTWGGRKAALVPAWPRAWHPDLLAHGQKYSVLGMLIKTALWREMGGFDPAYPRNADWKLLLQLAQRGEKVHWTPRPLTLYREAHQKSNRRRISGRHPAEPETERLLAEWV